jgi:NAD-dependent histone deacetylase SIR2
MDTSRLALGQVSKTAGLKTVDLSEEESEVDDALLATLLPRVNGIDALDDSEQEALAEEEEDSNDEWEIESLFEDTLEEMGDEHLFDGGEHSEILRLVGK